MSTTVFAWAPRDYVQLPEISSRAVVVDIGPGDFPLSRANVYVDRDPKVVEPISQTGKKTIVCDINKGFLGIPDKSFDYAWCSHVLEHVEDPATCAQSISRIAKAGTIVVPSVYKEALFNFEESTHRWDILPNPKDGPPVFIRRNREYVSAMTDELAAQALCFLLRTGSNHDCTAEIHLRSWFQSKEKNMDVVYHWTDKLELVVIA